MRKQCAWFLAAFGLAAICAAGCRRDDIRTVLVMVPDMKNPACETLARDAVLRVAGVLPDGVTVDRETRTLTVRYDSLISSLKNIEFAVADVGFSANDVPANPEAALKLPAECR